MWKCLICSVKHLLYIQILFSMDKIPHLVHLRLIQEFFVLAHMMRNFDWQCVVWPIRIVMRDDTNNSPKIKNWIAWCFEIGNGKKNNKIWILNNLNNLILRIIQLSSDAQEVQWISLIIKRHKICGYVLMYTRYTSQSVEFLFGLLWQNESKMIIISIHWLSDFFENNVLM